MHDDPSTDLVKRRFGAAAHDYVASATHAAGDDLARLVELAAPLGTERVLDVATGGGHTALAFARLGCVVTAYDLTPAMLGAAAAYARAQGVDGIRFVEGPAERMPFEDESFDVVVSRIAPHHFSDPNAFVRESARVLAAGGRFAIDDNMAPDDRDLDEFVNRFERWRDPSHVRAYTMHEWRGMIEAAGLTVTHAEPLAKKRYEFEEWATRMRLPAVERDALSAWLLSAPRRCREYFEVRAGGERVASLCATFSIILARKA